MCGIAGIVDNLIPDNYHMKLSQMVSRLQHRGPDDCGTDAFPNAVLGHSRLSIIDLSSGDQPMRDASRRRCIVFNGEIYGYRDIRNRLDYPFRTTSDTEVILALYDRYGTKMLDHLPGMFAFAIWDDYQQMLFAARDRFGEKPLYWALSETGTFLFASEIKAILASGLIRPKLNHKALAHYLNRLYVPVGQSIYETIHQLPPGQALTYQNGKLKTWRYWKMPQINDHISLDDAAEEFQRLLANAVQKQLVADVEVGAFLSGGLDSSTVVSIASDLHPGIRTFSFGFTDGPSEIEYARAVADKCGTHHVELFDSQKNIADLVEKMVDVYDEPFADSSAIPTYIISKLASQHLKVVLTGDGGDELLGGYPWYKYVWFHGELEKRSELRNATLYFVMRLWRRMSGGDKDLHKKLHTFNCFMAKKKASDTHRRLRDFVPPEKLNEVGFKLELAKYQNGDDAVDAAMRTDISDYLTGDILVKNDRASMANSLELRAPFLDVDFASFCLTLPSRLKINGNSNKILMRKAMQHRWPAVLFNREKQGFGAPVRQWLSRPEFVEIKEAYLSTPQLKIRSLLPSGLIEHLKGIDDDCTWAFLVLSIWLERQLWES